MQGNEPNARKRFCQIIWTGKVFQLLQLTTLAGLATADFLVSVWSSYINHESGWCSFPNFSPLDKLKMVVEIGLMARSESALGALLVRRRRQEAGKGVEKLRRQRNKLLL
jgi:hypothetical protein